MTSAVRSAKNKSNMTREEKEVVRNLKLDDSIMIVPADKGNAVVVINSDDYKTKVNEHLEDETAYEKQETDKTEELKKKYKRISKRTVR